MDTLLHFQIPVRGIGDGTHDFSFEIDDAFFRAFDASPVAGGDLTATLTFDKRPGLFVLDFAFAGTVRTDCDRCLAPIDLPIEGEQRLYVKLSHGQETPDEEDADIVVLPPDTDRVNVARYLYEYIILAIPLIKVYDCREEQPYPCNEEMLAYLQAGAVKAKSESDETDTPEPPQSNVWDALKDWGGKK